MSVAVKASARHVPALAVSLVLHCALLLPLLGGALLKAPVPPLVTLPNSVAMEGTSIEVDAPTPEFASAPGQAEEIPVEREAETKTETEIEAEGALPPARESSRPRPHSRPRPSAPIPATSGVAASIAGGSSEAPEGTPAPGTFGAERLAPGVRRVGYAFSQNIPLATKGDAAWRELPVGLVGTVRIVIPIGEANSLGEVEVLPPRKGEPPTPPALKRLVERTLILMRRGQLALSGSNDPGKELLIIEVRLRDEAREEDAKGHAMDLGFVGATPGKPGSATFRYDTGRVFEAKVTTMPAPN